MFVGDPQLGVETSVRTFDSLGRLAFRYEDILPSPNVGSGALGRLLRFVGRGLELVFLDEPLAELVAIGVHEVGGHGARARELGTRPTYSFFLPGIYRPLFSASTESSVSGLTMYNTDGIIEGSRAIVGSAGGLEAGHVHAWWINARIVRAQGWVHHGDLLVYALTKTAYMDSFLSSSLGRRGEQSPNDVATYVTELQHLSNGWRAEDRVRLARRIRAGYVWNLLDPTLLYAMWGTFGLKLFAGERTSRMPLPRIGDLTFFLSPRYNLSPFGAEQMLDVMLADRRGRMLDVYARIGTSGITSYWGAGARTLGIRATDRVTLGGELDVWRQPEVLLDQRGVFDPPQRVGMNASLYGDVQVTRELGITGKLGAKTPGYMMGLPIDAGLHGYLGISLAMF